jgi:acetyltransferase-like isoleucine patch superfamily enzyme
MARRPIRVDEMSSCKPVIIGEVDVGQHVFIGPFTVLGMPKEARFHGAGQVVDNVLRTDPVSIGDDCIIGSHVTVYEGSRIAGGVTIDDFVRVGYDVEIGSGTRVIYRAHICDRVKIGDRARIGGFICDRAQIGTGATVMGDLLHEYSHPHEDWWGEDEEAPVIGDNAVVGFGATVVGGVVVGERSYIAAGAIVTKDIPADHIVTGVNEVTPHKEWKGRRLGDFIRFWGKGMS